MAKRREPPSPLLPAFESGRRAAQLRARRQRALFIPRLVRESASRFTIDPIDRDRAYKIAQKWAELHRSGKLLDLNETTIDTQFLDQLFGEGLGYRVKTKHPDRYELEHKFPIPGVGTADAALGDFRGTDPATPTVVVELKGARTDLDRDRSNGRSAVQQCWDYLNALPGCEWGIVSNFSTIRLYHKSKGSLAYEEFDLEELTDPHRFNDFYALFERRGLIPDGTRQPPRSLDLLRRTEKRQKEVGDELYEQYRHQRLLLIEHLHRHEKKTLDQSIAVAQKLLDRVLFIAFCEDRGLLPEDCLDKVRTQRAAFSRASNPQWNSFLGLFGAIDQGRDKDPHINAFNGGLFADDPEINDLDLPDDPWVQQLTGFGRYDFSEEVNVDVLGNIFERSITELERLRVGGLFGLKAAAPTRLAARKTKSPAADDDRESRMPKSAQRKRLGIYYTPPAFTGLIVEHTIEALIKDRFAALAAKHRVDLAAPDQPPQRVRAYLNACLANLRALTICDPACGSGAFLIRAYETLEAQYRQLAHALAATGENSDIVANLEESIPDVILADNLYGVDLSREGVEITQLALWLRSARKGCKLADLSRNIVHGNSLVSDSAIDPHALDWTAAFPRIFGPGGAGGFSCVIGNPPWERVKVQDREFFSLTDPDTAEAVNASDRKKRIAAMPKANPELHAAYEAAKARAQAMLDYARQSGRYPLTGKGDVNLYMLFAELASSIVAPDGMVGLLVPSGIATDDTTKEFFAELMDHQRLVALYDFENRRRIFEDVDGRFKFSALITGGPQRRTEQADFVFFAHDVEEVSERNRKRHIALTAKDMALFNPNTRTCPIFRTRRDAELTRGIYQRVPVLIDHNRKQGGNPWGVRFLRMFDQTNDAEHFIEGKTLAKRGYTLEGNVYVKGKKRALPLYEAKMVQAFDHRAASVMVEAENWVRQGQKSETSPVEHANPEYAVLPRWWVGEEAVRGRLSEADWAADWVLGFKDITSATNERTMIASAAPIVAATNKFVLVLTDQTPALQLCLLANLNVIGLDYVVRQKVGGVTLNFFLVEQFPMLPPDTYSERCPWAPKQTLEDWVSQRVLKLTCTAEDMMPLAQACGFTGSRGDGVHIWKERERAEIRAELDAAYFHLYGIGRDDAEYILTTFSGTGALDEADRRAHGRNWAVGSIGEAVLDAYDRLAKQTGGKKP